MAPTTCCCSLATLRRWLPILVWMPHYSLRWLKMDVIAGLSVTLMVIPQALAYAEVAGLPPQVRAALSLPSRRLALLWASAPSQKQRSAWCWLQTRRGHPGLSLGALGALVSSLEHMTAFGRQACDFRARCQAGPELVGGAGGMARVRALFQAQTQA